MAGTQVVRRAVMERIESILGARLDESGWIAKLDIALKLCNSQK
ncbi:hypothetical protein [Paraburkholderia sp.]|nr:hypothetical protein [Paraburkholderia sp.]